MRDEAHTGRHTNGQGSAVHQDDRRGQLTKPLTISAAFAVVSLHSLALGASIAAHQPGRGVAGHCRAEGGVKVEQKCCSSRLSACP